MLEFGKEFSIPKLVNVFLSSVSYAGKEERHMLLAGTVVGFNIVV